jgi:hypothetical protein
MKDSERERAMLARERDELQQELERLGSETASVRKI